MRRTSQTHSIKAVVIASVATASCVAGAGCDSGGDSADSGVRSSPPTRAPDRTGSPSESVCAQSGAVHADVDGDGEPDRVVHTSRPRGGSVLRVCTATGERQEIPGLGQGESLAVADLNRDGAVELIYGATTVSMSAEQVAVWVGGRLTPVVSRDGDPLVLLNGYPQPSNQSYYKEWGCSPDGHLVQTTSELNRGVYRSVTWSIDGAMALVVNRDRGQLPAGAETNPPDIMDDCPRRDT